MCASYVLFKDFLPREKSHEKYKGNTSPHLNRVAIKELIKQIHRSKVPIGQKPKQEYYQHLLVNNTSGGEFMKDRWGGVLQNKKRNNQLSHYFSQKQKNSGSPSQFTDSQVALALHESVPMRNFAKKEGSQSSLRIISRHHVDNCFSQNSGTFKLSRHRNTQMLKLDLSLLQRKRPRSQAKTYTSITEQPHQKHKKSKLNLLNPEQFRINTISDRFQLKRKTIARLGHPKELKTSKIKIGNSELQIILKEEIEYIPQELKSSRVIFQKKDNLRKQFLINVKKLNKLNDQHIKMSQQEHSPQVTRIIRRSERKLRNNVTFHIRSKVKTEDKSSPLSKRTFTENFKFKFDEDNAPIEPW